MSEFEFIDGDSSSSSQGGSLHHHHSSRGPIPPILLETAKSDSPIQKHIHRRTPNFHLPRSLSTPLSSSTSSFRKQMAISPLKDREKEKDKPLLTLDVQMVTIFGTRKGRFRLTNSYMDFIAFYPAPTTPSREPPPSFAELFAKSPKLVESGKSDTDSEGIKSPDISDESNELRPKTPEVRAKTPEPSAISPERTGPRPQTPPFLPRPPMNEDTPQGHTLTADKWTNPYEKDYYIWNLEDLTEVHRTRYLISHPSSCASSPTLSSSLYSLDVHKYILRWISLEFFFTNRKNYFLVFSSEDDVKAVYNKIISLHPSSLTYATSPPSPPLPRLSVSSPSLPPFLQTMQG